MTQPCVVIATPHARNDRLEALVRQELPHHRVVRLRSRQELTVATLTALAPEYVFFPHWSWIIPPEIHGAFECVIFHMTDVPYGRGGSPLQNLIVRGHTATVVSAIRCSESLDAGPVYLKRPLSLDGTAEDILRRASDIIEGMIVEIARNRPAPTPQPVEGVELFRRRRPEDGDLAGVASLQEVYDYIRMLDAEGYPPAFLEAARLRLEFTAATIHDDHVEATVRIRVKSP